MFLQSAKLLFYLQEIVAGIRPLQAPRPVTPAATPGTCRNNQASLQTAQITHVAFLSGQHSAGFVTGPHQMNTLAALAR